MPEHSALYQDGRGTTTWRGGGRFLLTSSASSLHTPLRPQLASQRRQGPAPGGPVTAVESCHPPPSGKFSSSGKALLALALQSVASSCHLHIPEALTQHLTLCPAQGMDRCEDVPQGGWAWPVFSVTRCLLCQHMQPEPSPGPDQAQATPGSTLPAPPSGPV